MKDALAIPSIALIAMNMLRQGRRESVDLILKSGHTIKGVTALLACDNIDSAVFDADSGTSTYNVLMSEMAGVRFDAHRSRAPQVSK